jgi:Zn-finger protein
MFRIYLDYFFIWERGGTGIHHGLKTCGLLGLRVQLPPLLPNGVKMREHLDKHIERMMELTKDLYLQPNSICNKCHNVDTIYCIYCYCPLYPIRQCGGNFTLLENGIKDCSNCIKPHTKEFIKEFFGDIYI